jgi:ABC-type uncharacterized transport system substrate-binding protein
MEPDSISNQGMFHSIKEAASRLAVEPTAGGVHNAAEIEAVIRSFAQGPNSGIAVLPHAVTVFNASTIIALARQTRMPDIYAFADNAMAGGLVSYGLDWNDYFRRTAEYVNEILRGKKVSELPVQAPTKYLLVINKQTAIALGLSVPGSLLARADEVIE